MPMLKITRQVGNHGLHFIFVSNTVAIVHYCQLSQKNIATIVLAGIDAGEERRCLIRRLINNQCSFISTFHEATRAAGLSKSDDFINEVLDDATLLMNLSEEEDQERILREKEQINRST
ncbi:hypothetical protein TNCV_2684391 [Trichonephila clavipes]|nr:hypothetical protein TNCV_2684391 [Trichonephila clavipes]